MNRPRAADLSDEERASESANEFRKTVQRDVQNTVIQTLEPLLGANHFRVGVTAEVDLTSGDQSEETYDPQKSVVATSQTTQEGPGPISASGVPGTASNLPNPESKSSTQSTNIGRRSENVTYQTSRVVKHTRLPQGTLKRLSIAVLADHTLRWEGSKRILEPPAPEKLKVIRDLVAAATGLDTERGDQLVVEAFPFEATLLAEPLPETSAPATAPPPSSLPAWLDRLVRQKNFALLTGAGGAAVLILLGGLVFLVLRGSKANVKAQAVAAIEGGAPKEPATTQQDVEKQIEARMAEQAAVKAKQEAEALMQLQLPEVSTKKTEVLTKHIAAEAKKDPTVMAQVVRSWLHGDHRR